MNRENPINRHSTISIIGGSLVGPFTEILLNSVGFNNVTTYEAASANRPQSGGVLGVDETVYTALDIASIPKSEISAASTSDVASITISPTEITNQVLTVTYGGFNTTWDIFHRAVHQRTQINHDKKLIKLSNDDEQAILEFSDGTVTNSDLVIFADGRNSVGRKHLDKVRTPEYKGYVVWRGICEPPYNAPHCFTRFQNNDEGLLFVLSEPITQGVNAGKCDWALYHNLTPADFHYLTGKQPHQQQYFFPHQVTEEMRSALFSFVNKKLPQELSDFVFNTDDITLVPINDVPVPKKCVWKLGARAHAVLLGDALMPVRPHTARGLNNGLEQARDLVDLLVTSPNNPLANWEQATLKGLPFWSRFGRKLADKFGLGI